MDSGQFLAGSWGCAFATAPSTLFDQSANFLVVKHNLHQNKTILNMTYVAASMNISTSGICQSTAPMSAAPLFRVQFAIKNDGPVTSLAHVEPRLPDTWFGRYLGPRNGGLINLPQHFPRRHGYSNLDYDASHHFTAVGSDDGHDGRRGPDPSGARSSLQSNHQLSLWRPPMRGAYSVLRLGTTTPTLRDHRPEVFAFSALHVDALCAMRARLRLTIARRG
ncbi:hypothetical protein B0H13DRAFT_2529520 [Mycena leptocephala]|nr:hypothetical protein B0H13DRAFT_2529520 [Mycena leptocephala]